MEYEFSLVGEIHAIFDAYQTKQKYFLHKIFRKFLLLLQKYSVDFNSQFTHTTIHSPLLYIFCYYLTKKAQKEYEFPLLTRQIYSLFAVLPLFHSTALFFLLRISA